MHSNRLTSEFLMAFLLLSLAQNSSSLSLAEQRRKWEINFYSQIPFSAYVAKLKLIN
jgi:hypothetical protein